MSGASRRQRRNEKPKPDGPPGANRNLDPEKAAEILKDECDWEDSDLTSAIQSVIENLLTDSTFVQKLVNSIKSKLLHDVHESLCDEVKRSLNFEIETRDSKIAALEKDVKSLKSAIDDSEQYSRRNCLIFAGVEEKDGESTDVIIKDICRNELDVELDDGDIDRSHRLGSPLPDGGPDNRQPNIPSRRKKRHRNIIVKFTNYRIREKVYGARRKLRDSSSAIPVFINENLTKTRSNLFWRIKKAIRNRTHQIWTQDGVIIVKDSKGGRTKVTRESDLAKLSDLNVS